MKKNLLTLLLFTSPLLTNAQPYFNDGATWFYDLWPGDTISYVKIQKTAEVWTGGKFCDELTFSYYNFAHSSAPHIIRHYTYGSGDSVLVYKTHSGTFGILYDFSKQAGDTIYCGICTSSFILDSISQATIGTATLRTQHYKLMSHEYINYEKIGSTGFLIPHMQANNPSEPGLNLRCYQDNTGLYLHTGVSESCDDGNESHDNTTIQVMSGQFGVAVVSNAIVAGTEISIYDARGRLVVRESAQQTSTCYIEMQLDSRAIYFATIRNGEKYILEKFLLFNGN